MVSCDNTEVNKKPTKHTRSKVSGKKRGRPSLRALLPRAKKERRRVELLGAGALAVFMALSLGVFGFGSVQRYALRSPNIAAVVSSVLVELANGDRAQQGLTALTVNPVLVEAAQAKANDMAQNGYFAHVSPTGVDPWHWFAQAGYAFDYAGENLAVDFSDSADVNTAWMNSPTHRENILDPHYTEIGIATAEGMYRGKPTIFVVQEFGTPAGSSAQPAVARASVPEDPTVVATAATKPEAASAADTAPSGEAAAPAVLGSTAEEPVRLPQADASHDVATTAPALAATLARAQGSEVPLWGYLFGFPRASVHYAYYLLGLLVLLALVFDTGLQLHEHHRTKALHAGIALATLSVLFILSDYFFFAQPVLAAIAAAL